MNVPPLFSTHCLILSWLLSEPKDPVGTITSLFKTPRVVEVFDLVGAIAGQIEFEYET